MFIEYVIRDIREALEIPYYSWLKGQMYLYHHAKYKKTRLFYLTCEHVLFVYILKQRRIHFCGFKKKKICGFSGI